LLSPFQAGFSKVPPAASAVPSVNAGTRIVLAVPCTDPSLLLPDKSIQVDSPEPK